MIRLLAALLLVPSLAWAQMIPTTPSGLPLSTGVPGIIQAPSTDSTVSSVTASPDVTVTGSLGALNAALTVAVSGHGGVGFWLAIGTLSGTLVPEVSYDSGTTWIASHFFSVDTSQPGLLTTSQAISGPSISQTVVTPAGVTHARVRVSAYTSGTNNGVLNATANATEMPPFSVAKNGTLIPSLGITQVGGGSTTGPVLRAIVLADGVSSPLAGTEMGVVVRPLPAGTKMSAFAGEVFGFPPVSPLRLGGTPFTLRATATSNMTPPVVTQTQPPQPVMTFSGKIPGATVNNYVLDAVTVKILGPAAVASTIFARVVRRHVMYASTQTAAPAAGAAPTVANLAYNAAGNAGGTFQYECVGVDIWGYEGNYTANSLTASPGANQGVTVTCPALGAGAAGQNVYGTKTGAAGTLYFLGRTNGTTFQDITPDSVKVVAKSTIGAWGTTPAIETLTTPVELVMEKFVALGTAPTIISTTTFPGRLDNNRTVTIAPGTAVGRYRIPGQNEAKAFLTTPTITTALARDVDANYTYGATTQTDAAFGDIAVNSFNSSNATMAGTFVVWGHDLIGVTDAVNTLSNNAGVNQLAGLTEGSTLTMRWVAPPVFAAADEIAVEIGASVTAAATLLEVQISGRYF